MAGFFLLRALNGYGDPRPWQMLPGAGQTMMSFLNVSKYPPSPDFVLVTLGVSLLAFLGLQAVKGRAASVLLIFGRTPLFSYLAHLYIAHTLMLLTALATGFPAEVTTDFILGGKPARMGWGFPLPAVYAFWLAVLVLMYPLSKRFAAVKRRSRAWWTSYF
jgi:hypothetical protein